MLRQNAGICQLEVREHPSSNAAAGRSGQLVFPAASGRLLTSSSFGVVAAVSKESSSTTRFNYEWKLNPKPLFQPRLKEGRRFLRQFMQNCEGVVPGKRKRTLESADEFVQDGSPCKRTAMAAVFFMALGLVLQHEEAVSTEAMAAVGFALPAAFPWDKAQVQQLEPAKGTCATCIGVVDETLGACNSTANCVSCFDDRFVEIELSLTGTAATGLNV